GCTMVAIVQSPRPGVSFFEIARPLEVKFSEAHAKERVVRERVPCRLIVVETVVDRVLPSREERILRNGEFATDTREKPDEHRCRDEGRAGPKRRAQHGRGCDDCRESEPHGAGFSEVDGGYREKHQAK